MRTVKNPRRHGRFCTFKGACEDKLIEPGRQKRGLYFLLCMRSGGGCSQVSFTPKTVRLPTRLGGPKNAAAGALYEGATALLQSPISGPSLPKDRSNRPAKLGRPSSPAAHRRLNAWRENLKVQRKMRG